MGDMQKIFDMMSDASRRTRSEYHLTLKDAISYIAVLPDDMPVVFDWREVVPSGVDSYRGYYADLAIDYDAGTATAEYVLKMLKSALGKPFTGYKGGDYEMGEDTPLWASIYGDTGRAITDIRVIDGKITFITKDVYE